jgi:serine/threonine protein kinase
MTTEELFTNPVLVGSGTYGNVYRVEDGDGNRLAVKENLLEGETDFNGAIKEADLLVRLKGHPHIVGLKGIRKGCPFHNPTKTKDKKDSLYFILEYIPYDLHSMISRLPSANLGKYMAQILLGLEYMHGQGLAHRDIKPCNILWDKKNGAMKLCDFGLSRPLDRQGDTTPRVITCWYRAPEVVDCRPYDTKADMWSVGLVFAEMIKGEALFKGATDDSRSLSRMIQRYQNLTIDKLLTILDLPSDHPFYLWDFHYRKRFLEMLVGLLQVDPDNRWTATRCLDSAFFISHASLIDRTREEHPIPHLEYRRRICPTQAREDGLNVACTLFNQRRETDWYRHRIVFTSIDLYDRYLCYLHDKGMVTCDKMVAEIRYLVCLYVAIKYHLSLYTPPSIVSLLLENKSRQILSLPQELGECHRPTLHATLAAIEEELLFKVLKFRVYQPTPFCLSRRLDDGQVKKLLETMRSLNGDYDVRELTQ